MNIRYSPKRRMQIQFLNFMVFMFFSISFVYAQNYTVKGSVTDSTGVGLGDVSIRVKGSAQGTMTNEKGEYLISLAKDNKRKVKQTDQELCLEYKKRFRIEQLQSRNYFPGFHQR